MRHLLSNYSRQLVNYESVLAYSLLGILGGLASGLAVLAFDLFIDELGGLWGVGAYGEDFEHLPRWLHFALSAGGAVLLGLSCGTAAALFIGISKVAAQFSAISVILRFSAAGALTGLLALVVPEGLSMGDDTLALALQGKLALSSLLLIALCKLLATAVSCGAGMPIGLIGPNLLIGACVGGVLGLPAAALNPHWVADQTLSIVIGMGAAMGAVLNAPLKAVPTNASRRRWTILSIPVQATPRQAMDTMQEETTEATCVIEDSQRTGRPLLHGILIRKDIGKYTLASML